MKAYDYEAVVHDGAVYCITCLSDDTNPETDPEVSPIFADSEWDHYPVCEACGAVHDYVSLTTDGRVNEGIDPPARFDDWDAFSRQYVETALWSSVDYDDEAGTEEPMDANYGPEDIDPRTLREMWSDCQDFIRAHRDDIGDRLRQAGHDFWLTRNGHGAGFWDGDWPEEIGNRLDEACEPYGSYDLYVGDDGVVYGS